MSTVRFSAHVIGYVGDVHEAYANSPFAYHKWNCFTGHLPKIPLSLITGFSCLLVDQDYEYDGDYDDANLYRVGDDLQLRLTYMLTNPTASLRFCPETGFSFDDPDETIFRLSRS